MRALRLPLYQNMVNFRRENSYGHIQSYPLPTPSMVRGMAHEMLGLREYKPLKISIQGDFESVSVNVQKMFKFDRSENSRTEKEIKNYKYRAQVGQEKGVRLVTQSIAFVDSLINCKLLLHIAFDEESLTEKLYEKVYEQTVVLGRNEDIARVDFDNTKITQIEESDEEKRLVNSIFVNTEDAKKLELHGTSYRLPFYYKTVNSFAESRIFHKVDCKYIAKDTVLNDSTMESYNVDGEGDFVSFLSA